MVNRGGEKMIIVLFDGSRKECRKIEPSLKPGYIVIDEEYSMPLSDIICVVCKK